MSEHAGVRYAIDTRAAVSFRYCDRSAGFLFFLRCLILIALEPFLLLFDLRFLSLAFQLEPGSHHHSAASKGAHFQDCCAAGLRFERLPRPWVVSLAGNVSVEPFGPYEAKDTLNRYVRRILIVLSGTHA